MTKEDLRKTYTKAPESKLSELVNKNLPELTPIAIEALVEELTARKSPLLKKVHKWFRIEEELEFLIDERCKLIREHACLICGSEEHKQNGITLNTVELRKTKINFHIGCYNCLYEKFKEARDKHNLLGRGIWGIKESHDLLVENERELEALRVDKPSASLIGYARHAILHDYYLE